MLIIKLGKPSILCNTEVSYKECKFWNWYNEFRVEERLKSEYNPVIGLIESYDSTRESADLDIVVIVIIYLEI